MFLPTVRLRGLGHDGGRGVAVLDVTRTRTHHPRRGATLQSESCTQCRQCRNQYGDDDLQNLLLSHSKNNLTVKRSNSAAVCQCNGLSGR